MFIRGKEVSLIHAQIKIHNSLSHSKILQSHGYFPHNKKYHDEKRFEAGAANSSGDGRENEKHYERGQRKERYVMREEK